MAARLGGLHHRLNLGRNLLHNPSVRERPHNVRVGDIFGCGAKGIQRAWIALKAVLRLVTPAQQPLLQGKRWAARRAYEREDGALTLVRAIMSPSTLRTRAISTNCSRP